MHSKWCVLGEKMKIKRIVALMVIVGVFLLASSVKAQAATGSGEWEGVKENNSTIDFVKTMNAAIGVDSPTEQPTETNKGPSTQDFIEMGVFSIAAFVGLVLLMIFAFKVQRNRPYKLPLGVELSMSTEEFNAYHRRREEERQKIIEYCNKAGVDLYDAETGEKLTNLKEETVGGQK